MSFSFQKEKKQSPTKDLEVYTNTNAVNNAKAITFIAMTCAGNVLNISFIMLCVKS